MKIKANPSNLFMNQTLKKGENSIIKMMLRREIRLFKYNETRETKTVSYLTLTLIAWLYFPPIITEVIDKEPITSLSLKKERVSSFCFKAII